VVAKKGWRHLDTAMAGDAIKVVFVALVTTSDAPFQPEARLDGTVGHEVVTLLFQPVLDLGGEILHNAFPDG